MEVEIFFFLFQDFGYSGNWFSGFWQFGKSNSEYWFQDFDFQDFDIQDFDIWDFDIQDFNIQDFDIRDNKFGILDCNPEKQSNCWILAILIFLISKW